MCGDGNEFFGLFVSRERPPITQANKWTTWHGERSSATTMRWAHDDPPRLCTYQIRVTDEEDETHDVWIVLIQRPERVAREEWLPDEWNEIWTLPPSRNPLSATKAGRTLASPARLAQWIVEDLSEAGPSGVHAASFDAAHVAIQLPDACGGLVTGEATIGELLTHIGQPWALSWWIGLDDRLHVGVPGQWSAADAAALRDPNTPRITPADFAAGYGGAGSYEETLPADAEARGAATRKTRIEWSDRQRSTWPAGDLPKWAPGTTELPVQPGDEARLSGAWIYPPAAIDVLASGGARRCFPTRRITLRMHDWAGVLERQTLCLLSMPLAAPGRYVERAVRLEHTADDSREYVVARFEDLGPTAAARPAIYDSIENWWPAWIPRTLTLTLTAGSDVVAVSGGTIDPSRMVGLHLDTPGAAVANRQIARRITAGIDVTHFRVEFPFLLSETLHGATAVTPILDRAWIILESQETRPDNTTYLTVASETTGAFRSGSPGFTVSAG
jgi:hypothetical protein